MHYVTQRNHIEISYHAQQRLHERFPTVHKKNYNMFVSSARYNGMTETDLKQQYPKLWHYIMSHFHGNNSNSCQIRFYQGGVFIFSGKDHKAGVLRTVYALDPVLIQELT